MIKRITLAALLLSSAYMACAEDATSSASPAASPPASPAASPAPSHAATATSSSTFKNDKDKVSYSLGVDIGRTLQRLQLDLNEDALSQGIGDVLGGKPMAMTDQELQETLQAFQQKMMQKQQESMAKKQGEMKAVADKNKTDGKKFLDDNSKKTGVKTTSSGLQYKVIKEGKGDKPKDSDVVETNYRGTTIDGKEFDSSAKHGSTFSFPVNGVIKGWSEALKLMPVGSKWELYIPSELAYGDEGYGDDIPPGSTLVFEVELLGVKKNAGTAPPGADQQPSSTEKKPAGS
jgi:FKBP-type peptidyl-prolyl cis-trans isomerase FklB